MKIGSGYDVGDYGSPRAPSFTASSSPLLQAPPARSGTPAMAIAGRWLKDPLVVRERGVHEHLTELTKCSWFEGQEDEYLRVMKMLARYFYKRSIPEPWALAIDILYGWGTIGHGKKEPAIRGLLRERCPMFHEIEVERAVNRVRSVVTLCGLRCRTYDTLDEKVMAYLLEKGAKAEEAQAMVHEVNRVLYHEDPAIEKEWPLPTRIRRIFRRHGYDLEECKRRAGNIYTIIERGGYAFISKEDA